MIGLEDKPNNQNTALAYCISKPEPPVLVGGTTLTLVLPAPAASTALIEGALEALHTSRARGGGRPVFSEPRSKVAVCEVYAQSSRILTLQARCMCRVRWAGCSRPS